MLFVGTSDSVQISSGDWDSDSNHDGFESPDCSRALRARELGRAPLSRWLRFCLRAARGGKAASDSRRVAPRMARSHGPRDAKRPSLSPARSAGCKRFGEPLCPGLAVVRKTLASFVMTREQNSLGRLRSLRFFLRPGSPEGSLRSPSEPCLASLGETLSRLPLS